LIRNEDNYTANEDGKCEDRAPSGRNAEMRPPFKSAGTLDACWIRATVE